MASEPRYVIVLSAQAELLTRMSGREDEALEPLVRLRRLPASDYRLKLEFLEIKAARMFDEQTKVEKYGEAISRLYVALHEYKELFTVRHLRKRTMIACLLQVIQQFTGISTSFHPTETRSQSSTDDEKMPSSITRPSSSRPLV